MNINKKDIVSSDRGVPMAVRLVQPGEGMGEWNEKFGRYLAMNVSKEPLIEFYDTSRPGQGPMKSEMVARFSLSSLQSEKDAGRLLPKEWGVNNQDIKDIVDWVEKESPQFAAPKEKAAPTVDTPQQQASEQSFLSKLKGKISGRSHSASGPSLE